MKLKYKLEAFGHKFAETLNETVDTSHILIYFSHLPNNLLPSKHFTEYSETPNWR